MKIYPKILKIDLGEFEVFSVREKGWEGKKNGEPLTLMLNDNINTLITFDKNLKHQQNFEKFPISVLVLIASDNTYLTLKNLIPKIKTFLSNDKNKPGITEIS